jgi:hypothetical protein
MPTAGTKEKIKLESKTPTLPFSFAKDIYKESKGHLHPLLPFFGYKLFDLWFPKS